MNIMSLTFSQSNMQDPDITLLITQNQTLAAELAQCQADKEFVWSLWKKLQASNPDLTDAIGLVTQREKEKSETKDRKVLEIIQVKDDRIEELQNIVTKQAEEISSVLSKKVELTEKLARQQLENENLHEKLNLLEHQMTSEVKKEKDLEETYRKNLESLEKEKFELTRKVARLTADLDIAKSERTYALNRQKILEERIKTLEKEVSDKMCKFQDLVQEVEDSTVRLTRYESVTSQQRRDLDFKNQELENVRKELKELWMAHNQLTEHSGQQADLIRQLQSLQQDTQKMLKNQEDAFSMENTSLQQMFTDINTRYEAAKRIESELRQQVLELKKNLMDKEDMISSLQSQVTLNQRSQKDPEYSGSFLDIVQEVDRLSPRDSSQRHNRCRSLTRRPLPDLTNKDNEQTLRSRSLSPPPVDGEPRIEAVDVKKVAQLQKELLVKTKQVEELRRAHDNRLHRFQDLQASYKLAREEIKTLEFGSKSKPKKIKRADPRSLQKENSDEVWNELTFFKTENRSLHIEKMSLQEEVDLLRVQAAQDDVTVHELRIALQAQNEEFDFRLRQLYRENNDIKEAEKQIAFVKTQIQNKILLIEKLERDLMNAVSQRDDIAQEKSKLMSQLVATQQEASNHRMELADVRHQLQCALHQLEEMQQIVAQSGKKTCIPQDDNSDIAYAVAANIQSKKINSLRETDLCHIDSPESSTVKDIIEDDWEERLSSDESDLDTDDFNKTCSRKCARVKHSLDKRLTNGINKRIKSGQRKSSSKEKSDEKKDKSPGIRDQSPALRDQSPGRRDRSPGKTEITSDAGSRRDCATSPITFISATANISSNISKSLSSKHRAGYVIVLNRKARKAAESKQIVNLQQRVAHLLNQVDLLKKAKVVAAAREGNLQDTVTRLQNELSSLTGRLKASKQLTQKLQSDIEKLQKEKDEQEEVVKAQMKVNSAADSQEMKNLEAKLKSTSNELTQQTTRLKELKSDKDSLQDQVKHLQDKINQLERDVSQKRNLLENQKLKLKQAQEANKSDADAMEELDTKVKLLTDANCKLKVQIESLRKRLSLVVSDKKKYEDKFLKVSLELDSKTKQLLEATSQRLALESALSDLESSAKQQLHGLACQSEAAIDTARDKLMTAQSRLSQFHTAFRLLATELAKRTSQARTQLQAAKAHQESLLRDSDLSLRKAQNKAKDILNLSQSDLEDIMSADGDSLSQESVLAAEKKLDKRWLRKCEKILNSGEDFVHPLVNLLLHKVDERTEVIIKIPT
ncbi:centlein-like [Biomphalaria glabrata]|uniref:Centlein-like n=2 Tax=Biomphalaria glabrata TaxID=6526 RepID=A0A9W3AV30_BIOGL|nr:centlein-like [Biomphalaria glabrata]XP_055891167.1 centlein-like [Biomphalaria glabrata]XP_055891175.1 centlein-like [Biomphalaria glabrata]